MSARFRFNIGGGDALAWTCDRSPFRFMNFQTNAWEKSVGSAQFTRIHTVLEQM